MNEFDQIYEGDCVEVLSRWPEKCADLVFADPPFNIGYNYNGEYHDQMDDHQYINWSGQWMAECLRILKNDGTMFMAIGDEYAAELKVVATKELGLHLRNWIIWHYRFGQNARTKFARAHAHLFYLVKDPKHFTFNADCVKVMSGRQKNYADRRAFDTLGKVPDDVWDEFPRVCGTFEERAGLHPCQMPESLLARIIRACSKPGQLIVDPFAGSGTTLAVAKKLGRRYLGVDISPAYVQLMKQRLASIPPADQPAEACGFWTSRHIDELCSLYLESGIALDRLAHHPYLQRVFVEQFHVRIEQANLYTADQIVAMLKNLRKIAKLPRTLVQDDARSYNENRSSWTIIDAAEDQSINPALFSSNR